MSPRWLRVSLFVLIGLSLTVLTGWAGQLSLGQFAFVGLGAFGTASLVSRGMPFGVATEAPNLGTPSPESVGATTVRVSLHVDDPDAAAARAVAAGATEMFPVADQPYGWRQGRVVDPFGHHWLVGRRL